MFNGLSLSTHSRKEPEISQRPRYFAAIVIVHCAVGGGVTSQLGACQWGADTSVGVTILQGGDILTCDLTANRVGGGGNKQGV